MGARFRPGGANPLNRQIRPRFDKLRQLGNLPLVARYRGFFQARGAGAIRDGETADLTPPFC
jgi:hypothetical protein